MRPTSSFDGPTDLLVLLVLRRARLHGRGIARRLQQLSCDGVQLDDMAVSATVGRLLARGWIEAEGATAENSPPVPIYRLTQLGRQHCKRLREEYARMAAAIACLLQRT
jgi:DNA-binding PadR family transcriptional regulator